MSFAEQAHNKGITPLSRLIDFARKAEAEAHQAMWEVTQMLAWYPADKDTMPKTEPDYQILQHLLEDYEDINSKLARALELVQTAYPGLCINHPEVQEALEAAKALK